MMQSRRQQGFIVVDLISQVEAVGRYTDGWPPEAIIAWLCQHGRVASVPMKHAPAVYIFESPLGSQAAFWFGPDGRIVITSRHH